MKAVRWHGQVRSDDDPHLTEEACRRLTTRDCPTTPTATRAVSHAAADRPQTYALSARFAGRPAGRSPPGTRRLLPGADRATRSERGEPP